MTKVMSTKPALRASDDQSLDQSLRAYEAIDLIRVQASRSLIESRRAKFGQYFTPASIAHLMASMFQDAERVDLLDAGAGSGSLLAATVLTFARRERRPSEIAITAYEVDAAVLPHLEHTTAICADVAQAFAIEFNAKIEHADFITQTVSSLRADLFNESHPASFSHAILNPPYGKVRTDSETRRLLKAIGVEAGNLYIAFLALAIELLRPGGELVAITPRSFCNGPYFRTFRRWLLQRMAIDRVHVFESRSAAFRSDDVLQENLIFHAVKSRTPSPTVIIATSTGDGNTTETTRVVEYDTFVQPGDPDAFIHIIPDEWGGQVAESMKRFEFSLGDLQLEVSTGRVVDFRARALLRDVPGENTIPLVYPSHFADGYILWPRQDGRKPNALAMSKRAEELSVTPGVYVLVRRFSAKEEPRRIVAAVYDSDRVSPLRVGFENHLNYFHAAGSGLPQFLARGLAAYLNCTLVDQYFRHFSGHTQVNATDLRRLPYPSPSDLERLGAQIPDDRFPSQREIDDLVQRLVLTVADDPIQAMHRIGDALDVLKAAGMPRSQLSERSALVLLALLDLGPCRSWSTASNPMCGVAATVDFAREHYGKSYTPIAQEAFRQTLNQFVDASIAGVSSDGPGLTGNNVNEVFQVTPNTVRLARSFESLSWEEEVAIYLASTKRVAAR